MQPMLYLLIYPLISLKMIQAPTAHAIDCTIHRYPSNVPLTKPNTNSMHKYATSSTISILKMPFQWLTTKTIVRIIANKVKNCPNVIIFSSYTVY